MNNTAQRPLLAGIYRHYKGPYYKVVDIAIHSETQERLVVYQALYGEKGLWVRPEGMFTESVEINGETVKRFAYVDPQTEVIDTVLLDVKKGEVSAFQQAFKEAASILATMQGYISHSLNASADNKGRFILLLNVLPSENNQESYRQSAEYEKCLSLLQPFFNLAANAEQFQRLSV